MGANHWWGKEAIQIKQKSTKSDVSLTPVRSTEK